MPRHWNIAEQTVTVPEINYTFQFGSVHSAELDAGREPPTHDNEIFMKMWDPTKTRCCTLVFDRGGYLVRSELDTGEQPAVHGTASERAEDHSYQDVRPGEPSLNEAGPVDGEEPVVEKPAESDPGLVAGAEL